MALYERHVSKLEELIPAAEEVAALLFDISEVARRTNVEMNAMVPEPAEAAGFYTKTSYQMTIIGEYHAVGRFLTEVASLSRIITPVEVDVQPLDQSDVYPLFESPIVVSFRFETYVLPGQGGAPAPPQTGAGG